MKTDVRRNRSKLTAVMVTVVSFSLLALSCACALHAQQTGAKRNVLKRQDLSGFPGREGVVAQVEFAPGAHEGKHTHPGDIFGYVQEGSLTLVVEGQAGRDCDTGRGFFRPRWKGSLGRECGQNAGQGTGYVRGRERQTADFSSPVRLRSKTRLRIEKEK